MEAKAGVLQRLSLRRKTIYRVQFLKFYNCKMAVSWSLTTLGHHATMQILKEDLPSG